MRQPHWMARRRDSKGFRCIRANLSSSIRMPDIRMENVSIPNQKLKPNEKTAEHAFAPIQIALRYLRSTETVFTQLKIMIR